jgi:hypothetical protein
MQPLPGSSGFQMERRHQAVLPKSDYYDGIWPEVAIIDVIAAVAVAAIGFLRGWSSVYEFGVGYGVSGQVLIGLAMVPLLIGLYIRWRGGQRRQGQTQG